MKEILKNHIEMLQLPDDQYLEQDPEILMIFVEELDEIFIEFERLIPQWFSHPDDRKLLTEIRRHFHTLKGSGRMMGANQSSELAWAVEETLNQVLSDILPLHLMIQTYVQAVYRLYALEFYQDFKQLRAHRFDIRPFILAGTQLQRQQLQPELQHLLEATAAVPCHQFAEPNAIYFEQFLYDSAEPTYSENETLEIFLEEAEEHVQTLDQFLQQHAPTDQHYNNLVRALHTLRGSSSMAELQHVFDASSQIENLLKCDSKNDLNWLNDHQNLLIAYSAFMHDYLVALRDLKSQLELEQIYQNFEQACLEAELSCEINAEQSDHSNTVVASLLELDIENLLNADYEFEKRVAQEFPDYVEQLTVEIDKLITETNHSSTQVMHDYLGYLKQAYLHILQHPTLLKTDFCFEVFAQAHQQIIQLFDTIASGQRISLDASLQASISQLLDLLEHKIAEQVSDVTDQSESLDIVHYDLAQISTHIQQDQQLKHSPRVDQQFDSDVLEIFLEEANELLAELDADLNKWLGQPDNLNALNLILRHLHTLKGGANMVQANYIGLIAHELESVYQKLIVKTLKFSAPLVRILRAAQDDLAERIQVLQDETIDYPADHLIQVLQHIEQYIEHAIVQEQPEQLHDIVDERVTDSPVEVTHFDDDLECDIEVAENEFLQWLNQRDNRSILLQLPWHLHHIQDRAQQARQQSLVEIVSMLRHVFEGFLAQNLSIEPNTQVLMDAFHWLKTSVRAHSDDEINVVRASLQSFILEQPSAVLETSDHAFTDERSSELASAITTGDGTEPPSMHGEWDTLTQTNDTREMIRVSADLLEKTINLSGENAINRARIEMDLGQLNQTLSDMELTIKRLADQLRRMDGELESQIMAKHSDEASRYADFDPLEMDQYSSINQLSKALAESASDLVDFKTTLADKIRDTENLLLQQSRTQVEIQQNLMRTRLVPFSRLVPRLQRIVRQTSSALNRSAELVVHNVENELDRNILERLVTPLEHMLRNAIDHGLESREERIRLGKAESGKIELTISHQSTDILVSFTDDGKGIDVEKIRSHAHLKGLIGTEQQLSDSDILQLIFHPGFTTAAALTQISGRGVGLDIVQSEIKALGGHIHVDSVLGQGTNFTIRVPTTVAVNDALMVRVADQQFAVPLAQIERIVRIAPAELKAYFDSSANDFEMDHQHYRLRYLGEFIANQPVPKLLETHYSLPVLMIKNNQQQATALLVDQLVGSRSQIMAKPLGQQFSHIDSLAGATILGSGEVCLILDTLHIARLSQSTARMMEVKTQKIEPSAIDQRPLVMIVDDSVTVRKVTSRLLERKGFDVITAKDGVEAIEQLDKVKLDLLLLDIEMPRMDGFEVTTYIRHREEYQHLPIIMITSRTGEKHRERALSLGVNHYMGKPFQETELLSQIQRLLETAKEVHA